MALYAAWLTIVDPELNQKVRPKHLGYVKELYQQGKVAWAGPFSDKSGGMVVYRAGTDDEALAMAHNDPAVTSGARTLVVKMWDLLDWEHLEV
ncbi:MAG: YciI family protein [Firmicutes bacterium]|jgi:hypothetical protein|nr:YciI family protein [Bacillota bacterium]MCL5014810.1 YciI family protein [Bacillota bacterium]HBQ94384.1 hypothetical protein [Sulfobacillus sp.]